MATYAIGDVQGCYDDLMRLLDFLDFDEHRDTLWFAGDLVNRGPKSLATLRLVHSLRHAALTVLGNHDLHLLAAARTHAKRLKDAGLKEILLASDGEELLHWLQHRPLLHHDPELGYTLIHAGLPPQWDLAQAIACAREVETVLSGEGAQDYFNQMYGDEPTLWHPALKGMDRYRFITNCLSRLRYCDLFGHLALREKGKPGSQAKGLLPWYLIPNRRTHGDRVIFGHWSTLGYRNTGNTWAIDTGCIWGGDLTALRLDTGAAAPMRIPCSGVLEPGIGD